MLDRFPPLGVFLYQFSLHGGKLSFAQLVLEEQKGCFNLFISQGDKH